MAKTILVAGYTKQKNIQEIRSFFIEQDATLICAYIRQPKTEPKQEYLKLFDEIYDISKPEEAKALEQKAKTIDCVTFTQERDISAYIQSLLLCNKISPTQAKTYADAIDKHTFKDSIGKVHPELVPSHQVITEELLENLGSLTYPQVIKPSALTGSIMIRVVHSPEEFKKHYDNFAGKIQEIANEHHSKDVDIITESFVEGPQYSVNTYINADGDITFCPPVRVVTPQEMGINDTYSVFQYTTDELSADEIIAQQQAVKKIVKHFAIVNTSAHFDAVLNNGQWQFFEVGLRFGGHRQRLYELSHGMDTLKNDIFNRLGKQITIPAQRKNVCIMQKCAVTQGTLESISYKRVVTEEKMPLIQESKIAKLGTEVKPLSLGGGTITRHFIIGTELSDVLKTSKELFDSVELKIE